MVKTRRQDRIGSLVQEALSEVITRDLHLASGTFVAISRVEMTGDLKVAKVYLRIFGEASSEEVLSYLERHKSFIRKMLASRINIRYNPQLFLAIDAVAEHEVKIDQALEKIKHNE
ncbi:MAG: 30S ribosome-binding factor RbfA [Candidatus Aminicenantales bacterium]